jgi:hypothetical protein
MTNLLWFRNHRPVRNHGPVYGLSLYKGDRQTVRPFARNHTEPCRWLLALGLALVPIGVAGQALLLNFAFISSAAVGSASIKATPGQVYDVSCFNENAAIQYVRLYDQIGAPASTDGANIVWRGKIPGSTTGGVFAVAFAVPRNFVTGIGIRISGAVADNDATALTANTVNCNVGFK